MEFKAGSRFRSAVCDTQMVVVRAPAEAGELTCGGHAVIGMDEEPDAAATIDPAHSDGTAMGKRYVDPDGTIEVLVTKPGAGSLALNDVALALKDAKPLPASD
jgi:hypothetical protein